jgi:hypothetical protein
LAGAWHNLDSKLKQPVLLGETDEFMHWLTAQLATDDVQVFVVMSAQTYRDQTYLHPPYRSHA